MGRAVKNIENSRITIRDQIAQNNIKNGEVAFFDEYGSRIRDTQDGTEKLYIPLNTKRIVSNGDLDLTGTQRSGVLYAYVDGKVTGQNVGINELEVHATGDVKLASDHNSYAKRNVAVINGGSVELDGFRRVPTRSEKISFETPKYKLDEDSPSKTVERTASTKRGRHTTAEVTVSI